jgi:glycosyltransferase involved in cell wall biosynthesis
VIVPSRRFLRVAGVNKRYAVISGCIAVDRAAARSAREPNGSLRILVGGTLDNQQGLGLVLEAIELLTRNRPVADRLDFNLCGFAQDERRLKEELQSLAAKGARVCYHGALRPDEYRALLAQTDVCLAMQNPHDQHSEAKTPSKVYEYLAHGKAVIVSDVGDFSELPSDVVSLCDWNAIALARRLEQFLGDAGIVQHMRERAVDYAVAEYALASNGAKILSSLAPDQNGPNADV